MGFPGGSAGKESTCNVVDQGSIPVLGRSPGEGKGPTRLFWPGESHGLHSPWGRRESDTTERLSLTHSISCCIYVHIFYIHSSVDRHWGCFPVLSAVSIGVHVSFEMIFSRYMPRRGNAGLEMEILDLTYKWNNVVFVFLFIAYLAWYDHLWGPAMLLQMALFHSFSWLSNILLYIYIYIYICMCINVYIWSPTLQVDSVPAEPPGKPMEYMEYYSVKWNITHS